MWGGELGGDQGVYEGPQDKTGTLQLLTSSGPSNALCLGKLSEE